MLIPILAVLVLIVVAAALYVSTQPDEFRISRKATIAAPPAAVFPHVNDLHLWEAWSPWAKMDPQCVNTFEGPAAGQGAIFRWSGNNKVGAGAMTITESRPGELVRIKLEFLKPFKATNTVEFTFQAEGGQTVVSWSMFGENKTVGKLIGLVMNCEKMIGGQYEQGLAQMKSVVESTPSK